MPPAAGEAVPMLGASSAQSAGRHSSLSRPLSAWLSAMAGLPKDVSSFQPRLFECSSPKGHLSSRRWCCLVKRTWKHV